MGLLALVIGAMLICESLTSSNRNIYDDDDDGTPDISEGSGNYDPPQSRLLIDPTPSNYNITSIEFVSAKPNHKYKEPDIVLEDPKSGPDNDASFVLKNNEPVTELDDNNSPTIIRHNITLLMEPSDTNKSALGLPDNDKPVFAGPYNNKLLIKTPDKNNPLIGEYDNNKSHKEEFVYNSTLTGRAGELIFLHSILLPFCLTFVLSN